MDKKYLEKFIKIFEVLNETEDDIITINESLEKKMDSLQNRIDKYYMKDSLSDKQEDIFYRLQSEVDELEEDIEKTTELLERIDDALDLIDFDPNLINQRTDKLDKKLKKLILKNEQLKLKNEKYAL